VGHGWQADQFDSAYAPGAQGTHPAAPVLL
jgi:hypothetical protein